MVKDEAKKALQEAQQTHAAALETVRAELAAASAALESERATHARRAEELQESYQSEVSGTVRWVRATARQSVRCDSIRFSTPPVSTIRQKFMAEMAEATKTNQEVSGGWRH